MGPNETRTLWISVGAALFAVFLLYSWSQEQQKAMGRKYGSTRRVVIAKQDISEMETIDEFKLEVSERPEDFLEPEAVTEPESIIGQVAAAPIKKGEQLLQTKLLLPGPETGLSMEVSPGKRAITVPIDDMRGVSKLLQPGDRVDLIAALDSGRGIDQKREVRMIMQDVPILATGVNVVNKLPRRFEMDANGKTMNRINLSASTNFTTITLEVKPEEAQQLVFIMATSPGSLFAVLRNTNDRYINPTRITTVDDVLGKPTVRAPTALVPTAPMPAPVVVAPPKAAPPKKRKPGGFEEI